MRETEVHPEEARDFGAVLRHELNNPLTGILGNAELLLVEVRRKHLNLPEGAQARLETIAELAVRMRETVRRLSEEWDAQALDSEAVAIGTGTPQPVVHAG
jgi:signal transduction histidine kinase